MMTELSVMSRPEYMWLDLAAFAVFTGFAVWAIIAGKIRATTNQKRAAPITRRAA